MTYSELSMEKLMAEADRLGKEQEAIDERNKRRRAKGRKPLPDLQEQKDLEVRRRRPRTGGPVTVAGEDAIKLFEMRKAAMSGSSGDDIDDEDDSPPETPTEPTSGIAAPMKTESKAEEDAIRAAAAARKVQDLKNGRIDHDGNWSPGGQMLEGGDGTALPSSKDVWGGNSKDGYDEQPNASSEDGNKAKKTSGSAKNMMTASAGLNEFKEDLYERLRISFEALETTLSDLQGRVAEIVTATTPSGLEKDSESEGGESEFKELLSRKVPVVFDVEGTKMTFDAITVFHAPPCITVVSKSDSATIMPKPGARLKLTYDMDGVKYDNDPVTFLGTRFSLPMFGLSFVGFIRDKESDMMDVSDSD